MKGYPMLREAGWLRRGGDTVPSALVRLWQVVEAPGGWDVELTQPLGHNERKQWAHFDKEDDARAALADVYTQGETGGRWQVHAYDRRPALA